MNQLYLCECGCGNPVNVVNGKPRRFIRNHHIRPFVERFWIRVDRSNENGCWIWKGDRSKKGYGQLKINGTNARAHRIAYKLEHGIIPDGLLVLHRCNNPSCVRPSHLYAGTPKDNSRDLQATGYQNTNAGSRNGQAKLNEYQVTEIRQRYAAGDVSQYELARLYSVSRSCIKDVVNHTWWHHVT